MTIKAKIEKKNVSEFISKGAGVTKDNPKGVFRMHVSLDNELIPMIDVACQDLGINRTTWLTIAAHEKLKRDKQK